MNEVKILQGSTSLVYEGITNLEELKVFAEEKASKYKNIVVTDENVKECELQIKEITPYRTDRPIRRHGFIFPQLRRRLSEQEPGT